MKHAIALVAMMATPAAFAGGDSARDHDAARRALERGEVRPLAEILALVTRNMEGHVIEVEFETKDARHIYEFKLLTDGGKVIEVYVDAANGEIIKVKEDNP